MEKTRKSKYDLEKCIPIVRNLSVYINSKDKTVGIYDDQDTLIEVNKSKYLEAMIKRHGYRVQLVSKKLHPLGAR